ncbi:hypothetical protein E4T56_gene8161 [Termitomyces sp. T112]|nr:hypothetical protein E4T56_gene8161 [Termitomyces sp. T112]
MMRDVTYIRAVSDFHQPVFGLWPGHLLSTSRVLFILCINVLLKCLLPNSAPPAAVELAPTASAPVSAVPVTLQPQIPCSALLDMYNGACSGGEQFLQSCLTYIHLSRDAFDSNALKIAWVLSYMKTRHASTYMLQVFHCSRGVRSFPDWAAFEKDFCAEFFPLDPAKTVALTLSDRKQYGQGKHTLDEYSDSFWALVEQAAYPNGLQLCLTFWDGLHLTLVECIDNLAEGHPNDEKIVSWYKVAQDQWHLMESQRELCHSHSALHPALTSNLCHPAPACPMPAFTLAIPAACPLPLGIPMDVDATRQLCTALPLCWRCQKPGHFAQHGMPPGTGDIDLLDPLPLAFSHREALYKDDQSNSGALEEEHRGEFGGICELKLPDEVVEVGDQIHATTIHLLPSIVEIQASQTMSQWLAQAFAAKAMPQEFRDVVPPYLHVFKDVFSKASFNSFPECKKWDHAIELLPDSAPSSCKVYPLMLWEQDKLNAFLQENLNSSHICPSKSPMASPVFFIKKKDGSL